MTTNINRGLYYGRSGDQIICFVKSSILGITLSILDIHTVEP